ncbi:winged helix-turn-helix transcriptional regulator [Paraburkholderia flava]|uniref:winged helix-turn-helix transcriptional regulator n=1 Tax=Paraburkholderia flava TaxID=2547393 RepID=UPI00105D099F|nr:helix-turn-helix domain-containing protein [Paraburkholderia flava]
MALPERASATPESPASSDAVANPQPYVGDVFDEACSSRRALELIASKWTLLILPALQEGPMRNNALLRRIGGISQKVLSQTLRDLERNGLVIREAHDGKVPHVEYRLSELGRSLSDALIALDRWAETNVTALDAARANYDEQQQTRR